jgi:hypothetical protein
MAPLTPPVINPSLQILRMELGDGGAACAVAVATSAKKKQEKRALGGHETFKVLNSFGPAGRRNPLDAVKFDGKVRGPQLAGRTPSPHKGSQGKEASSLFCPNLLAAAKGGRNVEAKAVTKDDSDTVKAKPSPRMTWTTTRAQASADPDARQGTPWEAAAPWL